MRVSAGITIRFGRRSAPSSSGVNRASASMSGSFVISGCGVDTMVRTVLVEREAAEVKRDQQGFGYLLHVLIVGVDAPLGRHLDALKLAIVAHIVCSARPA